MLTILPYKVILATNRVQEGVKITTRSNTSPKKEVYDKPRHSRPLMMKDVTNIWVVGAYNFRLLIVRVLLYNATVSVEMLLKTIYQ